MTARTAARDRVVEHHVSRLLLLAEPWAGALLLLAAAAVMHKAFRGWWYAAGLAAVAALLGALAWSVTHDKSARHRLHVAVTAAVAGGWLAAADVAGFTRGTWYAFTTLIIGVALSWNIHAHARHKALGDLLSAALTDATAAAGLDGAQIRVLPRTPGARVIRAKAVGVPGEHTGEDFTDRARRIESGAGLPPHAVTASQDPAHSGRADLRISDPRVLDTPAPWPGPSHPGGSAGDPLRIGLWQDGEPVTYTLTEHHLVICGTTGSAKSTGGGWNLLAELVTRHDVNIHGVDITKGHQFLGPFEHCFAPWHNAGTTHQIITDPGVVREFFTAVRDQIRPRTDYLAGKGLLGWRPGCGLRLTVVWMEEGPDILDALGDAGTLQWVRALKAARSAGIIFVFSGQRIDFTQLPTIARAQLGGRLIFGLADDKDADLCLSTRQDKAGCAPEQWGSRHPGKAYLDAPCITDAQVPMALRTWYWGDDDTGIRGHAAAWPHTPTPAQQEAPVTAPYDPTADDDDELVFGADDTDPALVAEQAVGADEADGPDYPAPQVLALPEDAHDWDFSAGADDPAELDPAAADALLREQISTWRAAGRRQFRAADLLPVVERAGRRRTWVYRRLEVLAAENQVTRHDGGLWMINGAA